MFSKFFQKNKKAKNLDIGEALPERFSFMSKEEQLGFQDSIMRYFQKSYPNFVINFSEGFIKDPEAGTIYGMDNVAQQYYNFHKYDNADSEAKRKIISEHFNTLLKGKQEQEKILKNRTNYNLIKRYISVRLYPPDYLKTTGKDIIYREDLEGIITALVYDLPSTVIIVKPEDTESWKMDKDELFAVGFKNTFSNNMVDITQEKFVDNSTLWMIGGEAHLFASAFIYDLAKYSKLIGKYGSLISIPHRHMVLVFPINDMSILPAINQFIIIADGIYREGPGSISPNIFWHHYDNFTNLPYKLTSKEIQFFPPVKFVELLNAVAEGKK
jgi:hypothetical protein